MANLTSTGPGSTEAEAYQEKILPGVSRSFALTIPQLPGDLRKVVTNAYLLCRIADTIEDEPELSALQKVIFHEQFLAVLRGEEKPQNFAKQLTPLLSRATSSSERELIANAPLIVCNTHRFSASQRQVLLKCVSIMCQGMGSYQGNASLEGLADQREVDRYCYYVAGVVGEMLTELFCQYSDEIDEKRADMLTLAPSFGEGLQLTNILKDLWEDRRQGVCWLPRKEFEELGLKVDAITPGGGDKAFVAALRYMVGVAHGHLHNAFRYTLLIPPQETGIRRFCLWAIGLAVLTLRRIKARSAYSSGQQVKVSRRFVKATILGTHLTARHDWMLKLLFSGVTTGLPYTPLLSPGPRLSHWMTEPSLSGGYQADSVNLLLRNSDK